MQIAKKAAVDAQKDARRAENAAKHQKHVEEWEVSSAPIRLTCSRLLLKSLYAHFTLVLQQLLLFLGALNALAVSSLVPSSGCS